MVDERIDILKDILLELHRGASPESVQERFEEHFTGVSAMEISLMEHELMSADTGVTFEDVMKLCNVHANLFKGAVQNVEVADADQEGHPVYVFKQENLALRAALLRIRRLLENLVKPENASFKEDISKGLRHQFSLLGQFEKHYTRKEKLFFPIMERYGHDAPPKVMWGVDDEIRQLFKEAQAALDELPSGSIQDLSDKFETFAHEFEEMIFKEESILLMILLETFSQDDWLAVAAESDAYGYAIVAPTAEWVPKRQNFLESEPERQTKTQVIETDQGQLTITFTPKATSSEMVTSSDPLPMGHGYLSPEQANLILNHLPLEITFVNKDDLFQYYNDSVPAQEMIFKRTPSQIGRHVDLCHPPKVLDKVKHIFQLLKSGEKDKVVMWFKSKSLGKFVHVTYAAVRDEQGDFQGVLEYVQDIQGFFELDSDTKRDL